MNGTQQTQRRLPWKVLEDIADGLPHTEALTILDKEFQALETGSAIERYSVQPINSGNESKWVLKNLQGLTVEVPDQATAVKLAQLQRVQEGADLARVVEIVQTLKASAALSNGQEPALPPINIQLGPKSQFLVLLKYLVDAGYISTPFSQVLRHFTYRGLTLKHSEESTVWHAAKTGDEFEKFPADLNLTHALKVLNSHRNDPDDPEEAVSS